jgi:hypothetical protein
VRGKTSHRKTKKKVVILGIFYDSKVGLCGLLEMFFFLVFFYIFMFTSIEQRFEMLKK